MVNKFPSIILAVALSVFFVLPWGYSHYMAMLVFPVCFVLVCRKFYYYNLDFFLIFSFSVFYSVFSAFGYYDEYGPGGVLKYAIVPWTVFMLGRAFADLIAEENVLTRNFFVVLLFFSAIAFFSIGLDVYENGYVTLTRSVRVLGEGEDLKNATGLNALISPWISLGGLFFYKNKEKTIWVMVAVLLSLVALVFTIRMGNRTGLFIFLFSLLFSYFYNFGRMGLFRRGSFFLLSALALYFVMDLSESLLFAFQGRLESDEYGISSAGGRLQMMGYYFENLVDYPFGRIPAGYTGFSYAHNYFLDIAKVGGLIPMSIALLFSGVSYIRLFKFFMSNGVSVFHKNIFLLLNISFFSVFLVEPVIEGSFNLFVLYLFSCGVVASMQRRSAIFSQLRCAER